MNRTAINPATTQRAHNAAGHVSRVAMALNGSATMDGLTIAERHRKLAMDELRALDLSIRQAKASLKAEDARLAKDRAIIAASRLGVMA